MPRYNYLCADCGPFEEIVPLSAFADPQACPECAAPAPRALSAATLMGGGEAEPARRSQSAAHRSGCACCAAPGRSSNFQATPGKGPGSRSPSKAAGFLSRT